jgi:aspartate kinase
MTSNKVIKINKFGGASVCNATAVKKVAEIIASIEGQLVIVVSAMGKTTNNLEKMLRLWFDQNPDFWAAYKDMKSYHQNIIDELFGANCVTFDEDFDALKTLLQELPSMDFNFEYDKIVSFGEIISTKIVARYLQQKTQDVLWVDVRKTLKTDQVFREATVDWELSSSQAKKSFSFEGNRILVTQGFIGSTINNLTTTLGREGSDYTAAALAWLLDAHSVTVWKDVPGIMNADPKWLPDAVTLDQLSYSETVELSFFGAKVIHPKTLRPLQQKNIPLYVRSFVDPNIKGTSICNTAAQQGIPFYIQKENQILVTLYPQDFSFMAYDNITTIHEIFNQFRLNVNLIQMSALSYSICFDNKPEVWEPLKQSLSKVFSIKYNTAVELITIRHYDNNAIENVTKNAKVFLEQKTRVTVQFVLEPKS